jgi:hypothetical protein
MAAGCRLASTPISRVAGDPRRFHGTSVPIEGRVEGVRWMRELGVSAFCLVDGRDSLLVLTQGEVPREGARARCVGQVSRAFPVNGERRPVLLDEATLGGRSGLSNPRSRRN